MIHCPYCDLEFTTYDALLAHVASAHPGSNKGIANRIALTVEKWTASWKNRLKGWMVSWAVRGITDALEDMTPEQKVSVDTIIDRLKDDPNVPDYLKPFLEQTRKKGNPALIIVGVIFGVIMIIGMIQGTFRPLGNLSEYEQEKATKSFRLDPLQVITAWRRDPVAYEKYFDDLRDQGWSDERIAALKFLSQLIPGSGDLIRMAVREAFTPEIAKKFGQYEDFPGAIATWADKLGLIWPAGAVAAGEGVGDEADVAAGSVNWAKAYWAAHWDLPSPSQGFEMRRRTTTEPTKFSGDSIGTVGGKAIYNVVDEENLKLLLRALDIMPPWRDALMQIAWEVPTRVDVRRFWDMRTIDEPRMREIYAARGYHGKDLDDYVLWTKVYTGFPELLAMYKNGWINLGEVKSSLVTLGMDPDRADEMIKAKIKSDTAGRTAAERDLTKADIIKGVKEGVITRAEGAESLMDLGYDADEAIFILDINVPVDEETKTATLRELSKSDIIAGLKAEVVTEEEARTRLIDLRYSPLDADFILKLYKASLAPPEEPRVREAAKADILLGVKKGLITSGDGYLMLLDIGFTPEASQFILMVHAEESPFSPRSYSEFKDLTAKYRAAAGMEVKPVPEELKKAADEVVRLTREKEALERSITGEKRGLIGQEVLPEEATARLTKLQVSLHRAEAELERARTEYNSRLAEWRHGA